MTSEDPDEETHRDDIMAYLLNVQETMLYGCEEVFRGLRFSEDPQSAMFAEEALRALEHNRSILEALIDSQNQTKH